MWPVGAEGTQRGPHLGGIGDGQVAREARAGPLDEARVVRLVVADGGDQEWHAVRERLHHRVGAAVRDHRAGASQERELRHVGQLPYVGGQHQLAGELAHREDQLPRLSTRRLCDDLEHARLMVDSAAERHEDERRPVVEVGRQGLVAAGRQGQRGACEEHVGRRFADQLARREGDVQVWREAVADAEARAVQAVAREELGAWQGAGRLHELAGPGPGQHRVERRRDARPRHAFASGDDGPGVRHRIGDQDVGAEVTHDSAQALHLDGHRIHEHGP